MFIFVIIYLYIWNIQVVSAMVTNDLMSLVNTRPLDSWKETLALLCTVRSVILIKYLNYLATALHYIIVKMKVAMRIKIGSSLYHMLHLY